MKGGTIKEVGNIIDYKTSAAKTTEDTGIINWGDISDDDTVVQTNHESQWQTVSDKKHSKKNISANDSTGYPNKIRNPYVPSNRNNEKNMKKSALRQDGVSKSSLTSYLEVTKDKFRQENKQSIRVTMSFTPRMSDLGELLRVAKELLTFGKEIDENILLLPWEEQAGYGPINIDDLANPRNIGEHIRKYFNKPSYVNFQPGSLVYGVGIHVSTNYAKHEFMLRWNLNKQSYKQNNWSAYSLALAPMQKSSSAFIIGIAVGSMEKQDYELLNEKLSTVTGIEGKEVSFQNINQAGITQEFWKLANDKASAISKDKYS
jgi:hypothetical protein